MSETPDRKVEHLDIVGSGDVEYKGYNWFDDVVLLHRPAQDLSFGEVSLDAEFAGKKISAPLIIEGMTGGHRSCAPINKTLASVAQEIRIPMGVGSQRAAIEDPSLAYTFRVARDVAPDIPLIANLGGTQIIGEDGLESATKAVEMIEADALAIHLNPLQEIIQPEGDASFKGLLSSLSRLSEELEVPIVVKEVGFGMSAEAASLLESTGISGIDVAGVGGTNWAAIEEKRSLGRLKSKGMPQERHPGGESAHLLTRIKATAGGTFSGWGIPTPVSILEASSSTENLFIIGSGGVRTGLDAAKCIALGATYAGAALPMLRSYYERGREGVVEQTKGLIFELKTAQFLTGASSPERLRAGKNYVLLGRSLAWAQQRSLIKIGKF